MESLVLFRDRQELQSADLNNAQEFAQSALDHVVLDTIEDGKAYSGFDASKTGAAQVTVSSGRLYSGGAVFARNADVVLDMFNVLPLVTKKRVAIVTWGQTVETDVQPRDFLVDATTGATEPQSVAMESSRHAEVSTVAGVEAPDPTYPTTDANVTVIAYVLLDTNGVVSIEQWEPTQVNNLRAVSNRTGQLEDWRTAISGRVDTLATDLASLAQRLPSYALDSSLQALALIVKQLQDQLSKPAAYLFHHVEKFFTTADAETGYSGYSAKIAQGLRFPDTASAEFTMALLNPNDPNVSTYSSFILPYHVHFLRHDCKGYHRQHRCGQHTWHGHLCRFRSLARHRWRCGQRWLAGNSEWVIRELSDALKKALHENYGTWNDETYRDYIDNVKDDFPRAWLRSRYAKHYWRDFVDAFYWSHISTTSTLTAYHLAQTFLVSQDSWLTKVGVYFSQLAGTGDVDVMIVETDAAGRPLIDNVLSRTTVDRADLKVGTGSGGAGLPSIVETTIPITPTLLRAGQRYAILFAVQGDHWFACSDTDASIVQGTFFAWQSGAWAVQAGVIKYRLYFAQWPAGRTVIDLQPLSLAGGINGIDIIGEVAIPGATNLVYEVQIGGVWYPLDQNLDLSSLPALLPFRAVFVGSTDLMPGANLGQVKVRVTREATAFKYVSTTRALGGNAATIKITVRMDGFDDADHDLTVTVKTNAGATTETADTVADTVLPDGRVERVCTFNIVADNDYFYIVDGAVASINEQFFVTDIEDVATA